jgi:hypothetical protein
VAAAGALEMTGGQRAEVERLARSHTAPAREVRQAKPLLWAMDGVSNAEIARRCASTPKSVRRWRSRFAAEGTAAVGRIRAGRGRPVVLGEDVVELALRLASATRRLQARHGHRRNHLHQVSTIPSEMSASLGSTNSKTKICRTVRFVDRRWGRLKDAGALCLAAAPMIATGLGASALLAFGLALAALALFLVVSVVAGATRDRVRTNPRSHSKRRAELERAWAEAKIDPTLQADLLGFVPVSTRYRTPARRTTDISSANEGNPSDTAR